MANGKALSVLLLPLLILFVWDSPAPAFAAKQDPGAAGKPKNEPHKAMNEFCRQRSDRKDRAFCMRALKSDPRSSSAKNNTDLLYISVDLALCKTNRTKKYLAALSKKEGPKQPPLKSVLEDCVSAYDLGLLQLEIIPEEVQEDPQLASYDALMASDALQSCEDSLERNKITRRSISERHKMATAYVRLCVAIAMTIG